jgi:hypothetical protein
MLTILSDLYTTRSSPLCNVSNLQFLSLTLCPDIFLSPLFWITCNLHPSLRTRHCIWHPYKRRGKLFYIPRYSASCNVHSITRFQNTFFASSHYVHLLQVQIHLAKPLNASRRQKLALLCIFMIFIKPKNVTTETVSKCFKIVSNRTPLCRQCWNFGFCYHSAS